MSAAHTTSVIARSGFFESQSGFVHTRIVSWLVGPATVATDLTRTSRTGAVHTRHGAGPLFTTFSAIAILPKETRDPAPQAITILENDQMDQPRPPPPLPRSGHGSGRTEGPISSPRVRPQLPVTRSSSSG